MGMFDYVKVNLTKLPVTAAELKALRRGSELQFQTKDFECKMATVELTDDGELVFHNFDYSWTDEGTNAFGMKGGLIHTNERDQKINLHGYFNFYTNCGNDWFEFNAKFTDGKLVKIERATNVNI